MSAAAAAAARSGRVTAVTALSGRWPRIKVFMAWSSHTGPAGLKRAGPARPPPVGSPPVGVERARAERTEHRHVEGLANAMPGRERIPEALLEDPLVAVPLQADVAD